MSDEAIFQAETNSVQRLLSRRCKNVEDCHVGVSRLLAMTPLFLPRQCYALPRNDILHPCPLAIFPISE